MRQKRTVQPRLFDSVLEHDIAIELEAMSNLLDAHPVVLDWVESDLRDRALASTGRVVRIDSTVTDSPIATPSDSALLHDVVRESV